ncbi:MAG: efflux RND transporter permease subunit [Myxococcales bacterium]|nr:efflux RND transporter permease subunit [Myxococcales bacterium]
MGQSWTGSSGCPLELEALLREVPGTRTTFAERQTGREYIDIVPDREALARNGLTMRAVNETVETAIGGMALSTVVSGRSRFSVNLRYAVDHRADPETLRSLLFPVPDAAPIALVEQTSDGQGAPTTMGGARPQSKAGSMGAMGGPMGAGEFQPRSMSTGSSVEGDDRYRQGLSVVRLGAVASVEVVMGPPMIKDENGTLVGYVFVDLES